MRLNMLEMLGIGLSIIFKAAEACISIYISFALVLPCCLVLWTANEVARKIVALRLRLRFGDKVQLVQTAEDNVWSFKKPGNSRNILMLIVYKSIIDPGKYQENFVKRVLKYEDKQGNKPFLKFCKIFKPTFGYGCWKQDEKFDIRNHVQVLPIPEGRPFYTELDLPGLLSSLTRDMSDSHPQWEEIIIPRFVYSKDVVITECSEMGGGENVFQLKHERSAKVRSARIFRYHHVYMEGVSSLIMMKTCMVDGSFESSLDPLKPLNLSAWKKTAELCHFVAFGATRLIRHIYAESNADSRFLLNRFSGKIMHRWSQEPIDMKLMERIQEKLHCSQAEIVASAIGGAIRTVCEKYCTKPIWLTFPDTFEDSVLMGLPKFVVPYPSESPMNRFGVLGVDINTQNIPSRLERFNSVRENFQAQVKGSPVLVLNYWIMKFVGRLPLRIIQMLLADAGPPVVFSNIPWIKSGLTLMGDEVEEFGGWMPMLTRTGLGIVSARYCGKMRLCGVTETSRLSPTEFDFLLNEIGREITNLAKECGA